MPRFFVLSCCFCALLLLPSLATGASREELTALQLAVKGQYPAAVGLANRSNDALIRPLVTWLYLTDDSSSPAFGELASFAAEYPHWPRQHIIKRKAEGVIDHGFKPSDDNLMKWFRDFPPLSDDGKFAYLKTLHGKKDHVQTAMEKLREYWRDGTFYTRQQEELLEIYKGYLRPEDHIARLDTLIWREDFERARYALRYVPAEYKLLGFARIQLAQNRGDVNSAIDAVPAHLQDNAGLVYERVRWRRRKDMDDGALSLLNTFKGDMTDASASKWWLERHILARRAHESGNHAKAYAIAASHRQKDGFPMAQAEWLAGWLALNYLDQAGTAFKHFEKLFKNVETPISRSRGAYWAGLASDKKGYRDIARQWYKVSAQYYGTFYGQLAAVKLVPGAAPFKESVRLPFNPMISSSEREAFYNRAFVRAARLLAQAGLHEEAQDFMYHIANALENKKDYALYMQLARENDDWGSLLRMGKKAMEESVSIWEAAYPVLPYPVSAQPNPSLTYGLIRQESAFNVKAVSSAGARGLMQLMPATAREVARRHGLRYNHNELSRDPAYNIRLGQAYLQEMLNRFEQATPLAVAAYNAGPNRVDKWLKEFGDPRKGEIDWIDWMETIPIYETRNYVQRVLEAQHIYAIRLGQE